MLKFVYFFGLLSTIIRAIDINLNDGWTIYNRNQSIILLNQTIPSGIYSAMEAANLTGSVLYGRNDVQLRWIAHEQWIYSLKFNISYNDAVGSCVILVFHGIDTNARIFLNKIELNNLQPNNMFARYQYDVGGILLKNAENHLRIEFMPPMQTAKSYANENRFTPPECPPTNYNGECHVNFLRKMQASFSWDWGLAAPSIGLWKSVLIENYQSAIIRDVTYSLNQTTTDWIINARVYLEGGCSELMDTVRGYLSLNLIGIVHRPTMRYFIQSVDEMGEFSIGMSLKIRKNRVKLWWPNGFGEQNLYALRATWIGMPPLRLNENDIGNDDNYDLARSKKTIMVGFRTIEIIEEEMPAESGSGYSFYFTVNSIPIFMKGTNWIPSHILPEKSDDIDRIRFLLGAVRDAHMNMIRVWGGGIYESDAFYQLADEYGILIWHDMMFACAMYPVFPEFLNWVRLEIRQNVRRIQSHPSIALWAGNNENEAALVQNWYGTNREFQRFSMEYIQLYDEIRAQIEENDQWHPYMFSSPSNGIRQSNLSIIHKDPQNTHYGDIHHYDYLSNGWQPYVYPRPRFASEYGFQSFPAINSWKSILNETDGDTLAQLIDHRQHFPGGSVPINYLINMHLPMPAPNATNYWSTVIYFSQINQAMVMKAETEVYRAERGGMMKTMGALYWQLNDVWVAPSWSSIDYTGNFKLLHYYVKAFFAPTTIIAQTNILEQINLHVTRDTLGKPDKWIATLGVYHLASFEPSVTKSWNITIEENSAKLIDTFPLSSVIEAPLKKTNCFLWFTLADANQKQLATTFLFPDKIRNLIGFEKPHLKITIMNQQCDMDKAVINFKLIAKHPAYFVYIIFERMHKYNLSDNGFMQMTPEKELQLRFNDPGCSLTVTNEDLTILTVNDYF